MKSRWHIYTRIYPPCTRTHLECRPQCTAMPGFRATTYVQNQHETKQFRDCNQKYTTSRMKISKLAVTVTVGSAVHKVRARQRMRPTTRAFWIGVRISARFLPFKPSKQNGPNYGSGGACPAAAARKGFSPHNDCGGDLTSFVLDTDISALMPIDLQA